MKRFQMRRWVLALIIVVGMGGAYVAGALTGAPVYVAAAGQSDKSPEGFQVFWEAWDLVIDNFVDRDKVNVTDMTYGAVRGMLETLGDNNHTGFFTPEEAKQQAESMEGTFEGIGAYVSQEEGVFKIIAPIHGSPAEAAGVLAGDVVVAVDGEEVAGLEEWEVISKIRGPAGTTVVLTVVHPDAEETTDITIERGRIETDSVLWEPIPGSSLAYLQISQFTADTADEVEKALTEIEAGLENGAPVQGILLDLRNNPGGYLSEVLETANQFLDEDEVILHERDADGNVESYKAQGDGLARDIPIVAMINGGTASAGEILAGALQENGRAKLVGETTLGTGTVLRPYTLSDGSVLRLGVTNWLTPDFNLIKDEGVKPNVEIVQDAAVPMVDSFTLKELGKEDLLSQDDKQFRSALILLRLQTAKAAVK